MTGADRYPSHSTAPVFREDIFEPAKFDDDEEHDEPAIMCGLLSAVPAGFTVSFFIAVEGCFILANLFGTQSGASSLLPGLHETNPYRHVELVVLEVVGIANLVACVAIMIGLWLTRSAMPRLFRRFLDISQVRLACASLSVALVYRAVLLVVLAPWLGFMMAFDDRAHSGLRLMLSVLYISVSAYMVWILVNIMMNALEASKRLQKRLKQQDAEERYSLLGQAYTLGWPDPADPPPLLTEASPALFGCLPLESVVLMYMWVVLVACVFWLVRLFVGGGGSGGWAFFVNLPQVRATLGLEVFLNLFVAMLSLVALSALLLQPDPHDSENPWRIRKRVTVTLLLYFIANALRFSLFFPITGLAIFAKDVCGLYSHALADMIFSRYPTSLPLHCSGEDVVALFMVLLTAVVDGYFIFGVYKLWQLHRAKMLIGSHFEAASKAMNKYPSMTGWGTVPGRNYGISQPCPPS